MPDEDQGYAVIGVQLPDGASLQRTMAVYKKIDAILAKEEGIRTYNGIAGFSFFTRTAASYTRHRLHVVQAVGRAGESTTCQRPRSSVA